MLMLPGQRERVTFRSEELILKKIGVNASDETTAKQIVQYLCMLKNPQERKEWSLKICNDLKTIGIQLPLEIKLTNRTQISSIISAEGIYEIYMQNQEQEEIQKGTVIFQKNGDSENELFVSISFDNIKFNKYLLSKDKNPKLVELCDIKYKQKELITDEKYSMIREYETGKIINLIIYIAKRKREYVDMQCFSGISAVLSKNFEFDAIFKIMSQQNIENTPKWGKWSIEKKDILNKSSKAIYFSNHQYEKTIIKDEQSEFIQNSDDSWEIISKEYTREHNSVKLKYIPSTGYIFQAVVDFGVLSKDSFGIFDKIKKIESQISYYLEDANPKDVEFNVKTKKFTIQYSCGKKWSYKSFPELNCKTGNEYKKAKSSKYEVIFNKTTGWHIEIDKVLDIDELCYLGIEKLIQIGKSKIKELFKNKIV